MSCHIVLCARSTTSTVCTSMTVSEPCLFVHCHARMHARLHVHFHMRTCTPAHVCSQHADKPAFYALPGMAMPHVPCLRAWRRTERPCIQDRCIRYHIPCLVCCLASLCVCADTIKGECPMASGDKCTVTYVACNRATTPFVCGPNPL